MTRKQYSSCHENRALLRPKSPFSVQSIAFPTANQETAAGNAARPRLPSFILDSPRFSHPACMECETASRLAAPRCPRPAIAPRPIHENNIRPRKRLPTMPERFFDLTVPNHGMNYRWVQPPQIAYFINTLDRFGNVNPHFSPTSKRKRAGCVRSSLCRREPDEGVCAYVEIGEQDEGLRSRDMRVCSRWLVRNAG